MTRDKTNCSKRLSDYIIISDENEKDLNIKSKIKSLIKQVKCREITSSRQKNS
ncbi:hypothetical protein [Clostridium psychrophilum]|uniref:hypothetical protein n=1 Tax=Clostridium psychrophilum TaxID=132926 RepID=UPI001C0E2356|nr:hypothetical protein [Clostridium psychrophilum]MBU3182751.1 hypothetical protein [Clostridium psychrophilum]